MITPYYAQARKIRLLLKQAGVEGTTVCSVELMQGQVRAHTTAITLWTAS